MQSKDIVIGELYKVHYTGYGKVLETRVERSSWRGTTQKDGVRILMLSGSHKDQECVFPSRDIDRTWDEYKAAKDAVKLQQKIEAQEQGRMLSSAENVKQVLEAAGITVVSAGLRRGSGQEGVAEFLGTLTLTGEEMDKLAELLERGEVTPRDDSLSELL